MICQFTLYFLGAYHNGFIRRNRRHGIGHYLRLSPRIRGANTGKPKACVRSGHLVLRYSRKSGPQPYERYFGETKYSRLRRKLFSVLGRDALWYIEIRTLLSIQEEAPVQHLSLAGDQCAIRWRAPSSLPSVYIGV